MQRALVTGASRGIGRALVAELAGRGVEVVATARRVDDLADLSAAARLPLDVTSDASVAAAATAAGRIDLLVNNAAVSVAAPVEDTPAAVALAMFDTNVVGPLRLISAFLPGMRERDGGTVVNVSSVAGQAVFPLNGAMLSRHPVDRTLLHPLPGTCRQQLTQAGIRPKLRTVLADSGYVSEENFARADQDKLRLLAPLAKDPDRHRSRPPKRARHLDRYPATARARRRLDHPRGREDYKKRARTVEPVFGQLKTCQKLTAMSRRGYTACESEWLLACAAHNLRKLHRRRLAG